MFSKFDEQAKKVLVNMQKEMAMLKHPYIGSEHLFLSLLLLGEQNDIKILNKNGITYETFKNELIKVVGTGKKENNYYLYTPLLRNILEVAELISNDKKKKLVDSNDLLLALLEEGEGIAIRILLGMGIDIDTLYDEFDEKFITNQKNNKKLMVDSFGIDLNKKAKTGETDPVVGREKEIKRVLEILSRRTKNNPLLIGEAGVGKTAIVEELARMLTNNNTYGPLSKKRIISISTASLVAGTKYRGEFEERINKIITELEEENDIILFIDEIHTLVNAGGAEGAIDASNILKPALARGKIKIIGATTTEEYKQYIEKDKALSRRFQTVIIKEPDTKTTLQILTKLRPIYEKYHKVKISDEILQEIVTLSNRYIHDRMMPDKAIDVLDEVCSRTFISNCKKTNKLEDIYTELNKIKDLKNDSIIKNDFTNALEFRKKELLLEDKKNKYEMNKQPNNYHNVNIKDVIEVVESRSKIPILLEDKNMWLKVKNKINKTVLGQQEAVDTLCDIIKKYNYDYDKTKPLSFLFVGPSGVGKTLLVKEYAKNYYKKDSLIRLDMSEYKENHSVSKLIGSPPGYVGYDDNKNVFEQIKDNPHSLILLDEIEKASPDVINLFLQILDEGIAKNSKGEEINFRNTIIIMTSNIGCEKRQLGFNNNKNKNTDINQILGISFVNRINKIIFFNQMDEEIVLKIIRNKINNLRKKYKDKNINLTISKNIEQEIKDLCEYKTYGARKIDKVIYNSLENIIIDNIYNGNKDIKISSIMNVELV